MGCVNDRDADTFPDNVLRIAEKIAVLLNEVIDLKYRLFTEVELEEIEEKSVVLLEEYLCLISDILTLTRPDESEFQEQVSNPDFLFHDLFQENRKLRRILKRQRVAEELQRLKRRFYAVTNTDTCMSYMKQMDVDAQGFLERLTADKAKTYCIDLIEELQDLIERITKSRSNTKKQVVIESVTGVLTLGTAAATGVVAAVGIAGRTASAASSASAPAASRVASAAGSAAAPVVADVATGTAAAAANVGNGVSKVAVNSSTAAKIVRTTVNVGKIVNKTKIQVNITNINSVNRVLTHGAAVAMGVVAGVGKAGRTTTEAINIGTAVTNAKPHTANRNTVRHKLFRTFQETYSTVSSTTQSHTDKDTQTNTRTMALKVYEKLINDEDTYLTVEKTDCSVEA
ncbi:hypothetical protein Bpfe_003637 [Biomphalaria pfeifferi]|uniref:Uncharacterized protein n=1 Tax=Biomphalaria pfeifferi TaxID=112525 RepID=A0AAD8FJ52_BIOPF|nr:hypothetical protein Bpfe_003637 [Biomphalaria pfeifferi]